MTLLRNIIVNLQFDTNAVFVWDIEEFGEYLLKGWLRLEVMGLLFNDLKDFLFIFSFQSAHIFSADFLRCYSGQNLPRFVVSSHFQRQIALGFDFKKIPPPTNLQVSENDTILLFCYLRFSLLDKFISWLLMVSPSSILLFKEEWQIYAFLLPLAPA